MVEPAELGADAGVRVVAGLAGDVDLERLHLAGEHVALEAEAGDPERVDDVDRREVEPHRGAGRQHELGRLVIGADDLDAGTWVVELPLPLEADDLDGEIDVVVDVVDRAGRS